MYSSLTFVRTSWGKTTDKLEINRSSWTPTLVCIYNTAVRLVYAWRILSGLKLN